MGTAMLLTLGGVLAALIANLLIAQPSGWLLVIVFYAAFTGGFLMAILGEVVGRIIAATAERVIESNELEG